MFASHAGTLKQAYKIAAACQNKSQHTYKMKKPYLCAVSLGVPGYHYSVFTTVFTQERVLGGRRKKTRR